MKKLHLLKRTLLLFALIVGCVNYGWATAYISYNGDKQDTSTSISSSNVSNGTAGKISWTGESCTYSSSRVNIAANGSITFTASSGYNITKIVITSGSTSAYYGTWTSSPSVTPSSSSGVTTFDGLNASSVTVTTSSAFRCTSASHIKIYYEAASATALAVKTAPTKLNYKKGEKIDFTGLVLDATIGGNHIDVTSGYTAKIGDDTVTSGTTVLNSVGAKTVTFSYGGQTATQTIHVGDLESIALTTTGVKIEYDEGQTFDPENLVVTATYADGEGTPTSWTEDVDLDDCTFTPSGALSTSDDNVVVSYTWGSTTKTAQIEITVTAGVPYRVSFNAGTGSCATSYFDEASFGAGVTLPTATIGVTGWSFAGWATASTTNTEIAPTLYAAETTYKPEDNCTLYAVYKFTEGTEGEYKRATTVSEITTAGKVVIVSNRESKMLDNTFASNVAAPEEESSVITAAAKDVFVLTGNDTDGYTLTNGLITIGVTGTDNNTVISNTTTNSTWTINAHNTDDAFYFLNKAKAKLCLEHSGSAWCVYAPSTPSTNTYNCLKVYIPNFAIVYNSNPAAIINPTVAFTTVGDKALYVKNENVYDNAANVTGIAKTPVYTSSDATVATVSDAGVVTALKAGTTTIKATVAAEVGVNTEASASYVVTVKTASNVAGLKAITDASGVVSFTADLTDAVVTYVNGDHAYIQDASGAVYASCGSSLTAGKKINGAVSGSIKAANQIDEITEIDLNDAEITDGDIPAASVVSAATLAANKADYEGKLVSIENATVTESKNSGTTSGGKISDDGKTTEINLYAPDSNIEALKDAEGTFNGYISLYNGTSLRFNIYDQSQIVLTKNAPTAQTLSFESNAVELDEVTPAFAAFTGQTVSGAIGDVTYSIEDGDDESGVVSSINASTGAVVLSGAYGTATITATAAAKEVTEAGVTTPYTTTTKTYTVTVNPRYMVTFSVNGVETVLRQATSGADIAVPTPSDFGDYKFMGWSESTVDPTDDEPSMTDLGATVTPEDNGTKYFAVFALAEAGGEDNVTSTFTIQRSSALSNPYENNNVSWSHSNVTFNTSNSCGMPSGASITITLPENYVSTKSITLTGAGATWAGSDKAYVNLKAGETQLNKFDKDNLSYDFESNYKTFTLSSDGTRGCWIAQINVVYTVVGITYSDYRTSLPTVEVTITDAQYATFCYARELNVTGTGVTAYTASANGEGEAVTLTKISDNIIPANTGVILFAESAGNYEINVSETDKGAIVGNELVGVTTRTQIPETSADKYNYIFSKKNEVIGFYRASGAYLLPNRAYLSTSKRDAAAREFMAIMFDEGETTSLREIRNEELEIKNAEFFNLNGQRVATPVKGNIYIVNGKKVMFK